MAPWEERWQTTSDYAHKAGLAAAVNGGPWRVFNQRAIGLAAGKRRIWSRDDLSHGFFAALKDGSCFLVGPDQDRNIQLSSIRGAVSGRPLLLDDGILPARLKELKESRDARTAIGISKDGKVIYLVVADGRRKESIGATYQEMAELFISLGAYKALNLDGGNSVSMYIRSKGGLVNRPPRSWERESINHIGIEEPDSTINRLTSISEPNLPSEIPTVLIASSPPLSERRLRGLLSFVNILDRLFIGSHREWVVPAGGGLGVIVAILILVAFVRRLGHKNKTQKDAVISE